MARQKSSMKFAGYLEVEAAAPIDGRTVVPAKSDLTLASNFPYPYEGLTVYVKAEKKSYTLIGDDVTVLANWKEVGSGSGGTSITVDSAMSATSTNPVQNKVVKAYADSKAYDDTALAGRVTDAEDFITDQEITQQQVQQAFQGVSNTDLGGTTYSTDEQLTGESWIDGSPIYCRYFGNLNKPYVANDWITFDGLLVGANRIVSKEFHTNGVAGALNIIDVLVCGLNTTNGNVAVMTHSGVNVTSSVTKFDAALFKYTKA